MKKNTKERTVEKKEARDVICDIDNLPYFLVAEEAALLLRTTPKGIYTMAERGQLPGVTKLGFRLLIYRDDLLKWLNERRTLSSRE